MNILYLEDNPGDCELITLKLKKILPSCNVLWVETRKQFEKALLNPDIDLVLCDYQMPNYSGLVALEYTKEKRPNLPFILISGSIGEEKTIEMFEAGVTDFILKNNLQRLKPSILRALNEVEEKKNEN